MGRHVGSDDDVCRDEIEPSCGVLDEIGGQGHVRRRLIVDCGLMARQFERRQMLNVPDLSALEDGPKVGAVFLSHGHDDHIGYLPGLMPYLTPSARVFAARPTVMIVKFWLDYQAAKWEQDEHRPYPYASLHDVWSRLVPIETAGQHEFLPDLETWVHPAGHIGGACSFTFRLGGRTIHYSGDTCGHDQAGVLGATPLPDAWRPDVVAGTDCTYGATFKEPPDWWSEMDRLAELSRETLVQGRKLMIFVFSVHRAGAIAHELVRRSIARIGPVYLDGSAAALARLMESNEYRWCDRDQRINLDGIRPLGKTCERMEAINASGGLVALVTPGMGGPGGVGTFWRRFLMRDSAAASAFTGYVAPGTDGDVILNAARLQKAFGKDMTVTFDEFDHKRWKRRNVPFRCAVHHFRLGGHDGRAATIERIVGHRARDVVVCHGSLAALESVAEELRSRGGMNVYAVNHEPEIEL